MSKMAFHRKEKKEYEQYTVRILSENLNKIRQISKNENISINSIINQLLEYGIKDYYEQ